MYSLLLYKFFFLLVEHLGCVGCLGWVFGNTSLNNYTYNIVYIFTKQTIYVDIQ